MTLIIVDPPVCMDCPFVYYDHPCWCQAADRNLSREEGDYDVAAPDWCPLRKGDVVVRFKGGGLARLKEKWDAADAIFDRLTRGAK